MCLEVLVLEYIVCSDLIFCFPYRTVTLLVLSDTFHFLPLWDVVSDIAPRAFNNRMDVSARYWIYVIYRPMTGFSRCTEQLTSVGF